MRRDQRFIATRTKMSIAMSHLPSLSIFLALFMISVAKTSSSTETFEFVEHFLGAKEGDTVEGLNRVRQYLIKYGYMNSISGSNVQQDDEFDDILAQAVKKYQLFSHLNSSGVLDAKTLAQMAMPRCGMPDLVNGTVVPRGTKLVLNMSTGSYYTFLPSRWNKFNLTWALEPGTRGDARVPIETAFALWSSVSKFLFINRPMAFQTCDLKISFCRGDHGDCMPFSRSGDVLAHAGWPPMGFLHFNADKKWADGGKRKAYDIGTIGLHEIGHLLGLGHSKVKSAIMWSYINKGETKTLTLDDIARIRALYP